MKVPEADKAVVCGLLDILTAYSALPVTLPARSGVTEAVTEKPSCKVLLAAIRLLAPGGRIVDAPDAAGQPCVCAVRLGATGILPIAVLVSATDCGNGRTRICVWTAAYTLPVPGRAKRVADDLRRNILTALME